MPWKHRLQRTAIGAAAAAVTVIALFIVAPGMSHANPDDPGAYSAPDCSASSVHCQIGTFQNTPFAKDRCTTEHTDRVKVCVRYWGDLIYVYDADRDGKSAVADIQRRDSGGIRRICRNKSGYGTWAVCNFDWAETPNSGHWWNVYGWTFNQYSGGCNWCGYWEKITTNNWLGEFYD